MAYINTEYLGSKIFKTPRVKSMTKFHKLSKSTPKEINSLNSLIFIKEIGCIVEKIPIKKLDTHMDSLVNPPKHLRKK